MLCAGITLEGRKVLLGLALGSRESYEDWLGFGRDLGVPRDACAGARRRRRRTWDLEDGPRALAGRRASALPAALEALIDARDRLFSSTGCSAGSSTVRGYRPRRSVRRALIAMGAVRVHRSTWHYRGDISGVAMLVSARRRSLI